MGAAIKTPLGTTPFADQVSRMSQLLIRSAWQVYADGPVAVKLGATGFGIIWAALSDVAAGTAAAVLILFWVCDMALGLLRAVSENGIEGFSWVRFSGGFAKLIAAVAGVALGVGIDLLALTAFDGLPEHMAATGAITGFALAFATSGLKSLGHWFPDVAGMLSARIRGRASDMVDIRTLPSDTQTRIRAHMTDGNDSEPRYGDERRGTGRAGQVAGIPAERPDAVEEGRNAAG